MNFRATSSVARITGADLGIVRRGFFVVLISHCIKGGGAAFLLSMLTGNGEDLTVVRKNVWRGQNLAGK